MDASSENCMSSSICSLASTAPVMALMELIESLGGQVRMVGGCVRDSLLGLRPKDFDLATTLRPQRLRELEGRLDGLKVIPTGIAFGTVTVVYQGESIEVTTLREDLICDGRRAEVKFGRSFRQDAARRDFTMNALYQDLRGRVYDYYGGRDDLAQGYVRFVGDPVQRITEDYVRILRFFRFAIRFDFVADPHALEAIGCNISGLWGLSKERVFSELKSIFCGLSEKTIFSSQQQNSYAKRSYLFAKFLSLGVFAGTHSSLQQSAEMMDPTLLLSKDHPDLYTLLVQSFLVLADVDAHDGILSIVLCLYVCFDLNSKGIERWFKDMKCSQLIAKQAEIWTDVIFQNHNTTESKRICQAFHLLSRMDHHPVLRDVTRDAASLKVVVEGIEKWYNQFIKKISLSLSSQQRLQHALKSLLHVFQRELKSGHLRRAKPLLTPSDLMNQLQLKGKILGKALVRAQQLQWLGEVSERKDALERIRREFCDS